MEENRLDKVIENAIKSTSMEVEVRQPVMERIAAYEMKTAKRPRIIIILSYIYTLAASLVTLVLIQKISQYLTLVPQIPGSVFMIKFVIQGVFVLIVAFLLVMGLYYWQNARKGVQTGIGA